ncbi:MAG: hypothetical protein K6A77_11360 [Clostridiales bacterium]|nr:hypothetical protein [Clostridiales bacterium]
MKRAKSILSLILTALLVLSMVGCAAKPAAESSSEEPAETSSESQEESSEEESEESSESESEESSEEPEPEETGAIYEQDGINLTIPAEYSDLLEVTSGDPENVLFRVAEIASMDAAEKDGYGRNDGLGFLFSIVRMSEEEAQELVNDEVPGNRPFAVDKDGNYYVYRFATDVRFYRTTTEEFDAGMSLWSELIAWANSVPETLVADNGGILTAVTLEPEASSEADPEQVLAEDPFEGKWACGRASMEIAQLGDGYKAQIIWGSSADTAAIWNYVLEYDEAEGNLSGSGDMITRVYNEDGSIASEEVAEDQMVTISLNDNGNIVWEDLNEDAGADMEFEYAAYQPETPAAEAIASRYFRGVGSGTPAEAAYVALHFADENELWIVPGDELRDNLLEAWNSLSEDEQKTFDTYFMDVVVLLDNVFNDWSAVQTFVHEMGMENELNALRESPLAQKSWDRLKAFTLTLGNSTGE